jgi:squalene-hopene/tetraprenyl-beta-curcumene cyclase
LTSFVTMSLAGMGLVQHPVTLKGIGFLLKSARTDGSWPIDTNLATWLTTLSVNALSNAGRIASLSAEERVSISNWLLAQQYRVEHPYTHAAPGGWAWTNLPGGVPDADDTAGALLALRHLGQCGSSALIAAEEGARWLLGLQNRDGGIPTFCRGWLKLPFDQSSPDLTAHALRAWVAWRDALPAPTQARVGRAIIKAVRYLKRSQRADGSWVPLWFGNQHAAREENPTYGTSRVLVALKDLATLDFGEANEMLLKGARALLAAQNEDGGWSGAEGGPSTVEETALAIEGLSAAWRASDSIGGTSLRFLSRGLRLGTAWLLEKIESGQWQRAAPIGFYFARLWYYERLYPLIFTVAALSRVEALGNQSFERNAS